MSRDDQPTGNLAEAVALLERAGLIDYNGHVSARAENGLFAINSGASNRAAITPNDITFMDAGGEPGEGLPTPPKERYLHTAIYARRPDVGAIVHCHSTWCTMLSTCSVAYEPVFPQGSLVGEAPLFERVASINTPDLGDSLAAVLGEGRAALLQSHGMLTCGGTIQEAVVLALYMEENARRQMLALSCGRPYRVMTPDEIAETERNLRDPKLFDKAYAYYAAK